MNGRTHVSIIRSVQTYEIVSLILFLVRCQMNLWTSYKKKKLSREALDVKDRGSWRVVSREIAEALILNPAQKMSR
jgi:hypothetical protein